MDIAVLGALYKGRVKGVHEDDLLQAWSLFPCHVVQKHLRFLHFVTDHRGDFSWNDTRAHTVPCVNKGRIKKNKIKKRAKPEQEKKNPNVFNNCNSNLKNKHVWLISQSLFQAWRLSGKCFKTLTKLASEYATKLWKSSSTEVFDDLMMEFCNLKMLLF